MGKLKLISIIAVLNFLMVGCGNSVYTLSDDIADETMNQIVDAKKENDSSRIIDLLSENIKESDNIQEDAEKYLNFIEGEIISFEYEGGYTDDAGNENSSEIMAYYTLTTTEKSYDIEFIIHPDAASEKERGVQSLGIQEIEDQKEDICMAPDYKGIYTVTPDNHDEIRALEEEACEED